MWWLLLALVFLGAVYWLYWRLLLPHKYWIEKGVKQTNPTFFVGDMGGVMMKNQTYAEWIERVYNACPNTRYSGSYQFLLPALILRDPDLIKQIAIKDFDHFVDHRSLMPDDIDPLWSKNLFALTGNKWREMRSTLSPAFTSGKMKRMFTLISQSGEQFVKYFQDKTEDIITLEMKDTFTRFTNDVIANTAFGFQSDSLRDRENEFYLRGKDTTNFKSFGINMKLFGYFLCPGLMRFFGIQLFPSKVQKFFSKIVKASIESREKHNIVRPDMIHLLLEARKHGFKTEESQPQNDAGFATVQESDVGKVTKKLLEITDEDIMSQALIFFFGGFDTVSSLMCFIAYELAINPDVQEGLLEEIDNACKEKITYETVAGMKYLDMVVSETLRKWPISIAADRICTKPYTIEAKTPEEKPLHLEKDAYLWIPIFPIHRDPQYYPDPERFDPERFNDENKGKINPYTYMPFGVGPRNCIASRFALLETKILFCYLLSHFQIVPVEKTQVPLVLEKAQFALTSENGFWMGLKRRSKV